MKKTAMSTKFTQACGKAGLTLKKYSPEILVVAGVVGVVASAVMACRATTKVSPVLEKAKNDIDTIHKAAEEGSCAIQDEEGEVQIVEYTAEDQKKDLTITYAKTGLQLVKLYAPAVILGALSITSILASNNILRKRNVALAAAYAAVDQGFKEYRGRVVERFGEAVDRELRLGVKAKEIEEIEVDEKTGEVKTVKKTVNVVEGRELGPYAQFFDESCPDWQKDATYNLMFVRAQQQYANDLLRARGYLFLNEVYDMLGMEKTKTGQIVGWINKPDEEDRDGYVDFGILETHKEAIKDPNKAYERVILCDFNPDGNILDLMDTKKYYRYFTSR